MKKVFYVALLLFIVFLIYKVFSTNKQNVVVIGDYNIISENIAINNAFFNKHYTVSKLNNEIVNNRNSIKNTLNNSTIVIFSIGNDELNKIISTSSNIYKDIDIFLGSYKELFNNIRRYANKKVIVLGFYNEKLNNKYTVYANNAIKSIIDSKEICFFDINKTFSNNKSVLNNSGSAKNNSLINKGIEKYLNNIFNNNTCQN